MELKGIKVIPPEMLEEIARRYPNESNESIAESLGLSKWSIKARAERHGWHKSHEYKVELARRSAIRCGHGERLNTENAIAKRKETMKKQHASERARLRFGLDQRTNRHYRVEPKRKIDQRNYLKRRGYIIDDVSLIAYYTQDTIRSTRLESVKRGQKKGTVRPYYDFMPYEQRTMD